MHSTISCILVEDEEKSLNLMTNLINQLPRVNLRKAFRNPVEAYDFVRKNHIDLIILDIKMPEMDGLHFIEELEKENLLRPFIFVTAYDEFMIDALRKSAVDYLLKPVSLEQLEASINHYENRSGERMDVIKKQWYNLNHELLRFNFKNGFEIVRKSDIILLEAERNYTMVRLAGDREITVSQNIGSFEYLIEQNKFIRTHRSSIINPQYFRKLNRLNRTILLRSGDYEYKTRVSSKGIKILDDYFFSL